MIDKIKNIYCLWFDQKLVYPKSNKIVRYDGISSYLQYQQPDIYEYIKCLDFGVKYTINAKLYMLYHDYETPPKCYCGSYIKYFKSINTGFGIYCSNKCQREFNYISWKTTKHPFHRFGVQEKVKQTNLIKIGVEKPFESKLIQDKIIVNNLINYGYAKPNQRPEINIKLRKSLHTFFSNDLNKTRWLSQHSNNRFSKISDNFFKLLIEYSSIDREHVCFSENEFRIKLNYPDNFNRLNYYVDFIFGSKIIEFNGDLFHANPSIFTANDKHMSWASDRTAQYTWDMDHERIYQIKQLGYDVLTIWESDVIKNIENELLKCKIYLKEGEQ